MKISIDHEPCEARELEIITAFVKSLAPGATVQTGKPLSKEALWDILADLESIDFKMGEIKNVLQVFARAFEGIRDGMEAHFPKMWEVFRADFEQLFSLLFMATGCFNEELHAFRVLIDQGYAISKGQELAQTLDTDQ